MRRPVREEASEGTSVPERAHDLCVTRLGGDRRVYPPPFGCLLLPPWVVVCADFVRFSVHCLIRRVGTGRLETSDPSRVRRVAGLVRLSAVTGNPR